MEFEFKNRTLLLLFHMSRFNISYMYLNVGKHVQVACICITCIIVNSFETLIIAINILNTICIYQ